MIELSSDADVEKALAVGMCSYQLAASTRGKYREGFDAADKLSVLDFTAKWCGPCKMIAPEFSKMSAEFPKVMYMSTHCRSAAGLDDAMCARPSQ